MIIRSNKECVYNCKHFAIMPGVNVIPTALAEKVRDDIGFLEQCDEGYIEIIDEDDGAKEVPTSGRQDLDTARQIAAMDEDQALVAIDGMLDSYALGEIVRIETRLSVKTKAQEVMDRILKDMSAQKRPIRRGKVNAKAKK
jgi:hypothetical protein